jgi:CPA1 family monovalent cation:H+ antiporter
LADQQDDAGMQIFDLFAMLIVLTAACGYVNVRVLKLPPTIGLMALTLGFSMIVLAIGKFLPGVERQAKFVVEEFSFSQALLHGMLGFLLFAGAMHVNLDDLRADKWPIAILATLAVALSTAIVGAATWGIVSAFGFPLRFIDCLLFGALISPTDPIAVLSLLERIGAPKTLETQIAGESLFNDGVGVALFSGLLEFATTEQKIGPGAFATLFFREVVGGALFGLVAGLVVYRLLKTVDHYRLEILLSLALVAGGYAAAEALHLSGPIAMVVAGLLIGNHGRSFAMSETTIEHLDRFWGLLDEFLNAALFVMIGIEVLVVTFTSRYLLVGLLAVAVVLFARLVSVGVPVWLLRRWERFEPSLIPILTWGGLRGGISVALALSLRDLDGAEGPRGRELILTMTYVVVVFSILVQGLSVGRLTRTWLQRGAEGTVSSAVLHEG